jgi:hypothetical protein
MTPTPLIVHKVHDNSNGVDAGDGFSELQIDSIAAALAGLRAEIRDETQAAIDAAIARLRNEADMTEAVAELRGQVNALLNLLGGNDNNNLKLFEASETVRKVKLQNKPQQRTRQAKVVDGSPVQS